MKRHIKSITRILMVAMIISCSLPATSQQNEYELTIDDLGLSELEYNTQIYKSSTAKLLAQEKYRDTQIEYHETLMATAERAYLIQQIITVLIFIIVTILVLGGLYLSFLQFKADTTKQETNSSENGKPKTSFKISKDGIEFGSSVIGLIVLFMSFFFFNLYVSEVYTIKTNKIPSLMIGSEQMKDKKVSEEVIEDKQVPE